VGYVLDHIAEGMLDPIVAPAVLTIKSIGLQVGIEVGGQPQPYLRMRSDSVGSHPTCCASATAEARSKREHQKSGDFARQDGRTASHHHGKL